jgi:AraC-like DNA-binding protein
MSLASFNFVVFLVCLTFLLTQLLVKKKHTSHILFAVFCGSVGMILAQNIAADSIGGYKYLIGLGAVATCNCYWLLSRSLFRKNDAIANQHFAFALAISLLIFIKQGYLFASSTELIAANAGSPAPHILSEFTILLSSCVLVLSFWEGCRGYKSASQQEKHQRILFLATFGSAIVISKISDGLMAGDPAAKQWVISSLMLFVLINTQILMYWRYGEQKQKAKNHSLTSRAEKPLLDGAIEMQDKPDPGVEGQLAEEIKNLLIERQLFLQENLKVGDIAKILDLPEYRVSKALRNHLNAKNFNQYVNELRISYAEKILVDPNKPWPVLVVGLESGFASVGPFTRAFKAQTGYTPNQYRQNQQENLALRAG